MDPRCLSILAERYGEDNTPLWITIPGVTLFLFFIGWLLWKGLREKKTSARHYAKYQRLADERGLEYAPLNQALNDLSAYPPFQLGHDRFSRDVFGGEYRGRPLLFGEYQHKRTDVLGRTHGGVSATRVVAVWLPAPVPYLAITQRGLSALLGTVGSEYGRETRTNTAEFDGRFRVSIADSHPEPQILTPSLIQYLLDYPGKLPYTIRFEGEWVMALTDAGFGVDNGLSASNLDTALSEVELLNDLVDRAVPTPR